MKKLFYAIIAIAVAVVMASCTKGGGEGISGSIVGKWELTKSEAAYTDANGNTVTAKDVAIAMLKKELGLSDDAIAAYEAMIDKNAAEMAEADVEPVRLAFNADGTVVPEYKDEKTKEWKESPEKGNYTQNGNKLTISAPDEKGKMQSVTATVLSLTSTELKIQMSLKDIAGEGNVEEFEALGFNVIVTETFKRI